MTGASQVVVPSHATRVTALAELGKLRLSSLAVLAVVAGNFIGHRAIPPMPHWLSVAVGSALVAISGNAFNMFLERDHDALMRRTHGRPLPSGRLAPGAVVVFALLTAGIGLALLWWQTNALATSLSALIWVTYVFCYTPLKRRSTLNTLVGAVPGALPPVVGYAAATGAVDVEAAALFAIVFFWQVPHFLAIAWRHREDYARAGMKMLPVVHPDGHSTGRQMIMYGAALLVASIWPRAIGMTGDLYLCTAIFFGILFFVPTVLAARQRSEPAMRLCFLMSIVYLPVVLSVMVLDVLLRR